MLWRKPVRASDTRQHRVGAHCRPHRTVQRIAAPALCTARTVGETGEGHRELVHSDRLAVHEEIPAAGVAVLGKVHQGAGAIVDVNGRHPGAGLPKLQDTPARHHRLDHPLTKPCRVAIDPPGERRDDRQRDEYPARRSSAGAKQRPHADGRSGSSSVIGRGPVAP